jgi:hypothetical protein
VPINFTRAFLFAWGYQKQELLLPVWIHSPFSRAVQAVLLYRLQNAKYRLDSAGQLP